MFGNVEPALHAHLFPRRAGEPDAIRTLQPWALDWPQAPAYSDTQHGALRRQLAAAWSRR
jgi:diadenosine tetraphosphate (Ap4A) HIT family hydrolase